MKPKIKVIYRVKGKHGYWQGDYTKSGVKPFVKWVRENHDKTAKVYRVVELWEEEVL